MGKQVDNYSIVTKRKAVRMDIAGIKTFEISKTLKVPVPLLMKWIENSSQILGTNKTCTLPVTRSDYDSSKRVQRTRSCKISEPTNTECDAIEEPTSKPKRQYSRKVVPVETELSSVNADTPKIVETSRIKRHCTRQAKPSVDDNGPADLPPNIEGPKPKRQCIRKNKTTNIEGDSGCLATTTEQLTSLSSQLPPVEEPVKPKRRNLRKNKSVTVEDDTCPLQKIDEDLQSTAANLTVITETTKPKRKYSRKPKSTDIEADSCDLPQIEQTEQTRVYKNLIPDTEVDVESDPTGKDLMKLEDDLKLSDDDDDDDDDSRDVGDHGKRKCPSPIHTSTKKYKINEDIFNSEVFKMELDKSKTLQHFQRSTIPTEEKNKTLPKPHAKPSRTPLIVESRFKPKKPRFGIEAGMKMPSNYKIYKMEDRPKTKSQTETYPDIHEEPNISDILEEPEYEQNVTQVACMSCADTEREKERISPNLKPLKKLALSSPETQKKRKMYESILRDLQSSSEDESADACHLSRKSAGLNEMSDVNVRSTAPIIKSMESEEIIPGALEPCECMNKMEESLDVEQEAYLTQPIDINMEEEERNITQISELGDLDAELDTENIQPSEMETSLPEMVSEVAESSVNINTDLADQLELQRSDLKPEDLIVSDSEIIRDSASSTSSSASSVSNYTSSSTSGSSSDRSEDHRNSHPLQSCTLQSHSYVDKVSQELKSTHDLTKDNVTSPYVDLSMIADDLRLTDTETETSSNETIMSSDSRGNVKHRASDIRSDIDYSQLADDLRLTDTETESSTSESIARPSTHTCIKSKQTVTEESEFDDKW